MRNPNHDILFEPVKIGPVTAKNRFYQVPHCTGMGWQRPRMSAHMRGTKAEGGWGVVCTEWCSVHPSSDDLPYPNASLWDDGDIKAHSIMTDKVHEYGGLAGAELWLGGSRGQNLFTREVGMDVNSMPNLQDYPVQTRRMDKKDIRNVRRWHKEAALRAKAAGFDIVYVYATHEYLLSHFLSPAHNTRADEYGGSLENRVRLVRELIEETKDAVGDTCAVAVRFSADDPDSTDDKVVIGEQRDMLEMLGELPDLWDINISDYSREMGTSRFIKEGALEASMNYVKSVTSKPVVTVGRFTSPDTMASQIKRGICDFIGAARPSIADPFLPNKIENGQTDDIRECIGCNICYTGDGHGIPLHCTQNPTFSEGWRRGWHPENIKAKTSDDTVLVVGAGPTGLEATRALGQRGYKVMLAEAGTTLGGRVTKEATLPGLSEWIRVRDYRVQQIQKMANVDILLGNSVTAEDALGSDAQHIVIATGASWRIDGFGRCHETGTNRFTPSEQVFTPDDILNGTLPTGPTVVFDDDWHYLGSTIAELLSSNGIDVTYVTTETIVDAFSGYTDDQERVHNRLHSLGIQIVLATAVAQFDGSVARLQNLYTEEESDIAVSNLVTVTARSPNDALFYDIENHADKKDAVSLNKIGDCDAPGMIATAIFAGHRYAQEIGETVQPMKVDRLFFVE